MSRHEKVQYNLPKPLVTRIQAETARRAKVLGVTYGVQTGVVRQALEIGLKELEKKRLR